MPLIYNLLNICSHMNYIQISFNIVIHCLFNVELLYTKFSLGTKPDLVVMEHWEFDIAQPIMRHQVVMHHHGRRKNSFLCETQWQRGVIELSRFELTESLDR